MNKPEVVFFGSGPVAAKSLELLLENFKVLSVVTKPKPEYHKGDFPVIDIAQSQNITIHTVSNKKELSGLIDSKPFRTDVAILIDFGIIVSQDVIDYFPKGIVNSHFSLLPEWRGADPITFAILSGQAKTGVSLMTIDEGMDTGKILAQKSHAIVQGSTTASLTHELILLSNAMLEEYLPNYLDGSIKPRSQPHPNRATYSRKLTKEDSILDFDKSAEVLEREIRAYLDWPKSIVNVAGIDVIITKASVLDNEGKKGKVEIIDKQLIIYCSKGALNVERLKPSGKSEMPVSAFIAGYGKYID